MIILAGGLGTRLRSVLSDRPKPMAQVGSKPFLEWVMDAWIRRGARRFILSVGHRADCIMDHFGDQYRTAGLEYAVEGAPLGTGGALCLAAQHMPAGAPFFVVNGDTFFDLDAAVMAAFHDTGRWEVSIALAPHPGASRYDRVDLDGDGRLRSLGSGTGEAINAGIYLFSHRGLLEGLGEGPLSLEKQVIPDWIQQGRRVGGILFRASFLDIGVPEDYSRAPEFFHLLGRQP